MNKKKRPFRPGAGFFLLCLALIISGLILFGAINARVVRVKYESVSVSGLDDRLVGTRVLFVSDLKLTSAREAQRAAKLMKKLDGLNPDIIIIGGDVTDKSLLDLIKLATGEDISEVTSRQNLVRDEFFMLINDLSAPVVIVPGDADTVPDAASLKRTQNIVYLNGEQKAFKINGAKLTVYGCGDYSSGTLAGFNYDDDGATCVIAVTHDPNGYRNISIKQKNGLFLADLVLSGHTLGGQISVGGFSLFHAQTDKEYPVGTSSYIRGVPLIVSSGIGCEYIPLRIGTRPTAHLITLTKGSTND